MILVSILYALRGIDLLLTEQRVLGYASFAVTANLEFGRPRKTTANLEFGRPRKTTANLEFGRPRKTAANLELCRPRKTAANLELGATTNSPFPKDSA